MGDIIRDISEHEDDKNWDQVSRREMDWKKPPFKYGTSRGKYPQVAGLLGTNPAYMPMGECINGG